MGAASHIHAFHVVPPLVTSSQACVLRWAFGNVQTHTYRFMHHPSLEEHPCNAATVLFTAHTHSSLAQQFVQQPVSPDCPGKRVLPSWTVLCRDLHLQCVFQNCPVPCVLVSPAMSCKETHLRFWSSCKFISIMQPSSVNNRAPGGIQPGGSST